MPGSFYQEVHRLRDGAVMVYRRGDTKQQVYQARLKVPGVSGYVIRSLKTRDAPTALNHAEDLFYELRAEQKLGMDVRVSGNLKFKDLWKRFYAAHESGLSVHRQRLHYLLFMANSGLRPNEARQLCWRDLRIEKDAENKPALVVEVAPTTKTGARTVVCREGTQTYLDRLKKLSRHCAPDDLVFCGSWTTAGASGGRSAACATSIARSACFPAFRSTSLAKNMGTSITYIEKHYSHVLTVMQAKELRTKKFKVKA